MAEKWTDLEFRSTLLWRRAREIHGELVGELRSEGLDPNVDRPEWDSYQWERESAARRGKVFAGPTPAFQEAWRRACEEHQEAAEALRAEAGE